jgi:hypothetical protein
VTGIRRTRDGALEAIFVARFQPDHSFTGAGPIELRLCGELVQELEDRLAELPVRRRGSVAWHPAEVSVLAVLHGPTDRPVRDAVLRGVLVGRGAGSIDLALSLTAMTMQAAGPVWPSRFPTACADRGLRRVTFPFPGQGAAPPPP